MTGSHWTAWPLLAGATALACGGSSRPAATPSGGGPAKAALAAESVATTLAAAITPQAPASLAGTWSLRAEGQTRRGPTLELAVDSLAGSTFRVRVAFLMQGNVGIEPSQFEATRGHVEPDGTVYLTVKARAQGEPMGEMAGVLVGDTVRLRTYRWAGEDQAAGGTRWLLAKLPP